MLVGNPLFYDPINPAEIAVHLIDTCELDVHIVNRIYFHNNESTKTGELRGGKEKSVGKKIKEEVKKEGKMVRRKGGV